MSSEHVSIDEESRGFISKITASLKKISIIRYLIILLQHYLRYSYIDDGNLQKFHVAANKCSRASQSFILCKINRILFLHNPVAAEDSAEAEVSVFVFCVYFS